MTEKVKGQTGASSFEDNGSAGDAQSGDAQAGDAQSGDAQAGDAQAIGVFAGISGLVEVGLGSTLHAYRIPFKGHALAYLQNILLVTFGKALEGRGLLRIAFISAMLKAFSPFGARVRPMVYIFLQGLCFAAPVRLLGWNLPAVLAGSVIMAWFTLGASLFMDYVMFGTSIFSAFAGAINFVGDWLGITAPSLFSVFAGAFAVKGVLAVIIGGGAYLGNSQSLIQRLIHRGKQQKGSQPKAAELQTRSQLAPQPLAQPAASSPTAGAARAALGDILRWRFALTFLISVLLLFFFANLPTADFVSVIVRGLCISYLAFVAIRRIDMHAVGEWLDDRVGMNLGQSLPVALGVLRRRQKVPSSFSTSRQQSTQQHSAVSSPIHWAATKDVEGKQTFEDE